MRTSRLIGFLSIFTFMVAAPGSEALAQSETVLYSFHTNGRDGFQPYGGLVFDTAGNLYGTTSTGGLYNGGTVFELSPKFGGGWTRKILHQFIANGLGGSSPQAGLTIDAAGNLYGTTLGGGRMTTGTVFELIPTSGGNWKERPLYSFGNSVDDGAFPYSGLAFDSAGNLYGTTSQGGMTCLMFTCGTVYELMPTADGSWKEKILVRFDGGDGIAPTGGVIFDGAGNLYGTASQGGVLQCSGDSGTAGCGTVFKLSPNADGSWTQTVLHRFVNGFYPYGSLVFDGLGNLFGTTFSGGQVDSGTIFELTANADGSWTEKIIYNFGERSTDGILPFAGLLYHNGNFYGTTTQGGTSAYSNGTVFELKPRVGGGWGEAVLHSFRGTDGSAPWAGLIVDAVGNLYGTTIFGGPNGGGTVFEIQR
jgi:uncharacterized repeat protein (TIGR03803 family)